MPDDLIGVDLKRPRRVVRSEGNPFYPTDLSGVALEHRLNRELCRVKLDGKKKPETWHRSWWRLAKRGKRG